VSRKRPNRDGSVYWVESKQRWEACLWIGWKANGRPDRKYFAAKTQGEVVRKLDEAKRQLEDGRPVRVERQTVSDFLTRWLDEAVQLTVKPKTAQSYRWAIDGHLIPGLGRFQLAALGPQDVQRFINEKAQSGLAPHSVKNIRDTLRAALNQAMRWDLVQRNVAELVKLPPKPDTEKRVWSVSEANRFLAVIRGHRLEALFRLALCFGVRQGEALALSWVDVDFEGGYFHIRGTQQRVDGALVVGTPKTRASRRRVPFALGLGELLTACKHNQDHEREWAAGDWEETGRVFTTRRGTPLDVSNLAREYRKLVKASGLPYIAFHTLRATAASLLFEAGLTDEEVAVVLGHSNTRTTQEHYLHATPDSEARAVRTMERVFSRVAVSVAVSGEKGKPN
jgi:integrase